MPRIAGVNIPDNKKMEYALPYIFGIGNASARQILDATKVDPHKCAKELTAVEINKIQDYIEKNYKVEGALRQETKTNIKRLIDTGSYRGSRHQRHLPVRGQRTKTNSRTVRSNVRKTVGSGRRRVELK